MRAVSYSTTQELDTAFLLMFSSSLVNQTIYGIMKPQFREAFKKTFMCGLYDGEIRNQI